MTPSATTPSATTPSAITPSAITPSAIPPATMQTEVRFGQPHNALVFDNRALDRPHRRSDGFAFGRLTGHLEAQCDRLVGDRATSTLPRIREAIADNARRGEYRAEPLAKRMGMSLRTLERHVRAQGQSVRRLLDEARQAHAQRLLSNPRLGIDEVASRVGYSAESAFRRAFKRWSGMSPAQFRRGERGPSTSPAAAHP
ncbi:MAG: AraC family transcriptional regulator [Myxococcota bacterium]